MKLIGTSSSIKLIGTQSEQPTRQSQLNKAKLTKVGHCWGSGRHMELMTGAEQYHIHSESTSKAADRDWTVLGQG